MKTKSTFMSLLIKRDIHSHPYYVFYHFVTTHYDTYSHIYLYYDEVIFFTLTFNQRHSKGLAGRTAKHKPKIMDF